MWGRYMTESMAAVWSAERRFGLWAELEWWVLREQANAGLIPEEWVPGVAPVDLAGVAEAEGRWSHELVGFLELLGWEHVHIGLTSSDVMDVASMRQMLDAGRLVVVAARSAASALEAMDGGGEVWARTHGMPAESVPRGQLPGVLAGRLMSAAAGLVAACGSLQLGGKLRGPVGVQPDMVPPEVESAVLFRFGLRREAGPVLQVADRGRWLVWLDAVGGVVAAAEQAAVDLRLFSQPGWGWELAARGAGSSAMPHKANPIEAEQVSGLGRVARGLAGAARETWSSAWGHRDLSNSSVERLVLPSVSALAEWCCLGVGRAAGRLLPAGPGAAPPGGVGSFADQQAALSQGAGYVEYRRAVRSGMERGEE